MDRIRVRRIRRGRPLAACLLLAVLALGACGGDDQPSGGGNDVAAMERLAEEQGGGGDAGQPKAAAVSDSDNGGVSAIPSVGDSVVKNADLRLEVASDGVRTAVQRIEQVAPRYGGFVLSTSIDEANSTEGVVVIRIPSEDFEVALRDVKNAGDLVGENVSGRDVSQEFIDLGARIRNLEAQEAVLLDLMERATTIGETITVQNNLSGIQLEIERLRGRLNFLEDRTSLGTISVAVVEAGAPSPSDANAFAQAWEQAVDILEGLGAGSIVVLIGFVLPVGAVLLLGLLIFRAVRPRFTS